jgi:molecular chaperone IbpA
VASPRGRSSGSSTSPTNVQVKGATFDNGLLRIELVREIPEAMKPRQIAINGADNLHKLEAKVA